MHWTLGLIIVLVLAFIAGAWMSKNYPGTIPIVS